MKFGGVHMKTNNIQQVCLNRKESEVYSDKTTFEAPADSIQPHLNMNKGFNSFFDTLFSLHPELSSSVHVA